MRGEKKIKKHLFLPDERYQSLLVARFINKIMLRGQKETAKNLLYESFDLIEKQTKKDALEVFEQAIENAAPLMEVVSRRIGGANYQVPMEVVKERGQTLAMRWLIGFARKMQGKSFPEHLADELIAAFHKEGAVIKKREDTHKMAEANKAFAHFARF